jgi:hypothetical protein
MILAFGRLRQDDDEFEASLHYTVQTPIKQEFGSLLKGAFVRKRSSSSPVKPSSTLQSQLIREVPTLKSQVSAACYMVGFHRTTSRPDQEGFVQTLVLPTWWAL